MGRVVPPKRMNIHAQIIYHSSFVECYFMQLVQIFVSKIIPNLNNKESHNILILSFVMPPFIFSFFVISSFSLSVFLSFCGSSSQFMGVCPSPSRVICAFLGNGEQKMD